MTTNKLSEVMVLKILRYKNYGCTMGSSKKEGSIFEDKFYWSFFELNNGKTISLNNNVNYKQNEIIHSEISCHYTQCYIFGEDFFVWWEKTFKNNNKEIKYISRQEEELVVNFFKKNIEYKREIKTEIINL